MSSVAWISHISFTKALITLVIQALQLTDSLITDKATATISQVFWQHCCFPLVNCCPLMFFSVQGRSSKQADSLTQTASQCPVGMVSLVSTSRIIPGSRSYIDQPIGCMSSIHPSQSAIDHSNKCTVSKVGCTCQERSSTSSTDMCILNGYSPIILIKNADLVPILLSPQ